MLKNNEYSLKKPSELKPRNIFNPHMSVKAILGWINFNLIKISKILYPYFVHGINTGDLSNKME